MFPSKWIAGAVVAVTSTLLTLPLVQAQQPTSNFSTVSAADDNLFLALREAARRDDAGKAFELAERLGNYPMPSYVDYYRLKARFRLAAASDIRDFLSRYDGSAIADRLRNDWLLELARKRDWTTFDEQYPLFVLKDDSQLKCYALMSRALKGQNVDDDARSLLISPKEYGEGCTTLVATLVQSGQFNADDLWVQVRLAAETNAGWLARRSAVLLDVPENQVLQAIDYPALVLARGVKPGRPAHEIFLVALGRVAKTNHLQAAHALTAAADKLTPAERTLGWAQIALQASLALAPEAAEYWHQAGAAAPLSVEGHQWKVRAALRAGDWKLVKSGIEVMPASLRSDPTWVYWLGRALKAEGDAEQAQALFASIADQTNFYGQLALEELGRKIAIPPSAPAASADEIAQMAANPGFARAFKFFALDLRFEGRREWNWELRKLSEREHLAAAEFARQNNVLDRMVHTSDRTRTEVDFSQRFPSPFRDTMQATTQKLGLDMAWAYGLIRQESRFVMNARSQVGASGLMQLMPATARYVAKKIGLDGFTSHQVNDIGTNIVLGTNYLNMVLNDLDGSQAMATAAYNAGPGRPRSWRSTLTRPVEGAIFAESIPFSETRGYVKNVLSNATYYAALFENKPQSLKARLGLVAPKGAGTTELP
jgi:soluble lytic murein transglycosylase